MAGIILATSDSILFEFLKSHPVAIPSTLKLPPSPLSPLLGNTVIWFIFVLKIISVFNFGGDLISFL